MESSLNTYCLKDLIPASTSEEYHISRINLIICAVAVLMCVCMYVCTQQTAYVIKVVAECLASNRCKVTCKHFTNSTGL